MNIEIISNINMSSVKFYLKEHTLLEKCSFGNYLIDLLDTQSSLYHQQTDVIVCFLDIDTLNHPIDDLFPPLIALKKQGKCIILSTLSSSPNCVDTYLNHSLLNEIQTNQQLLNFASLHHLLIYDFATDVKKYGYNTIFTQKYWYMGKIKLTPFAFKTIAHAIETLLFHFHTAPKKCLVLDCDNTLWGGIVSEGEIDLSNEGKGAIFQEFQHTLKTLKKLGFLLAINSKNNYDDVIAGLTHHASVLTPEDFIIIKANWEHKHLNLLAIANELEIGMDALVFIDDNPVERALVKEHTSAIVPDFPENIYSLNEWFKQDVIPHYFYKFYLTTEDLTKHEQYHAKFERNKLAQACDYDTFLKQLNIQCHSYIDVPDFVERYAQLTQKTNQFNLTTKRYTTQEISSFIQHPDYHVIALDYCDNFAKEGIVGLAIIQLTSTSVIIDTFLLSCRVLKRNIEHQLMEIIESLSSDKEIQGRYIATPKNALCADMYIRLGFSTTDGVNFIKRKD